MKRTEYKYIVELSRYNKQERTIYIDDNNNYVFKWDNRIFEIMDHEYSNVNIPIEKMTKGMLNEYTKRFDKTHACEEPIKRMALLWNRIPYGEMTPFAQAMPDEYKDEDAVKAYRAYYQSKAYSKGGVRYVRTSYPDWWGAAV